MLWQWREGREGKQQFLVVMLLFVMTGLAIVVYLNQTPLQPRERDYAYAGSFYAFAIWIGMGVGYITNLMQQLSKNKNAIATIAQREGHPIILTNGDNDTFPLWYNHEVEGVRTDTRDCNLEYLQTDWYIDQMKRPAYDSPALPISFCHEDYQEGRMEYLPINIDSINIGSATISLKGKKGLYKNELMVLEMLSQANWERPIYSSISMGTDNLSFLHDHLVLEGLAYRISPEATGLRVDVERLYDNMMHRFRYGGLNTKGIYVDEDVKHMANTHQLLMGTLIDSLLQQNNLKRAMAVCRKWQQEMPSENVPYTEAALSMAKCYYMTGQPEKGDEIICNLLQRSSEWLSWIETIIPSRRSGSLYSQYTWLKILQQALVVAEQYERNEIYHQYIKQYEYHIKQNSSNS